jgi:dodecin
MAVAKVSEITASSPKSFEDALHVGIARADKTLKTCAARGSRSRR